MTRDDTPARRDPRGAFPLPREIAPPPDAWPKIAARLARREGADDATALLPAEVPPPVDLWPGIAARLEHARSPSGRRAALVAAAAVVLVAVVFVAARIYDAQRHGAGDGATAAATPEPDTSRGAALSLREPAVSEDVIATMRRELALVHDERLRIEQAIDLEPDNASLRELWAYTYEVELDLADTWTRTVMTFPIG